jgi:hypothetical protein
MASTAVLMPEPPQAPLFSVEGNTRQLRRKGTIVERLRRTLVSLGAVAAFVIAAGWKQKESKDEGVTPGVPGR